MMTLQQLYQRITPLYDPREARSVILLLLEEVFGLPRADIFAGALRQLSEEEVSLLETMMQRLENAEPVQYVLGKTWFSGHEIYVSPGVLIPRPETEQLCSITAKKTTETADILDIGTGSGCIAITLALELPHAHVTAYDISQKALDIARGNAMRLNATVNFEQADALNLPTVHNCWDIIVSNPPYICRSEAKDMARHVLEHEPEQALFVDNDDPLCFYRAIAQYALSALRPSGHLCFEVNSAYAQDIVSLLTADGFSEPEILEDEFGHPRFVTASLPHV